MTFKNSLQNPRVRDVIDEVWRLQAQLNPVAEAPFRAALQGRDTALSPAEMVPLFERGSFACPPEIGRHLYTLVRAMRPRLVVEFGTSHGFSTLHIAAALKDNGHGRLLSTDMSATKLAAARAYLERAGLSAPVEMRHGEAAETLSGVADVDFLYLDGWVSFYREVLAAVEPGLRPGALVQADDVVKFGAVPGTAAYLDYVRDPGNGYVSVAHSDYQGFELSCWTGRA